MKKILLLLLSFSFSLHCIAQLEVSPAFDSKKKTLYLTFMNTTQCMIMVKQRTPLTRDSFISYLEIIFLDEKNKEIARKKSDFSSDNIFLLKSKEQKITPHYLGVYGYQSVKMIKVEYVVLYSTLEEYKRYRLSNSVLFEWDN